MNVFNPFDLLPAAWESGDFPWHPEDDAVRGAAFESRDQLVAWASDVARRWSRFVAVEQDELDRQDRALSSPRGALRSHALLSSLRWHTAYHYRQLREFAAMEGAPCPKGALGLRSLTDLTLPDDVF